FKELLMPFLLCWLTLNFIFMAGYLVKAANLIIGRGVPLLETLYVLFLALPEMISYTVPISILTAILIVYGNFSQNNEIRAVKASGIHPFFVIVPALLVGLALSFVMFIFNDQITSNAGFLLRRITKQLVVKHPQALIEPGRSKTLNENITFFTRELNGNFMKDIVIYENEGSETPVRTIVAESGEIIPVQGGQDAKVRLYNGSVSDAEDKGVQAVHFKTFWFALLGRSEFKNLRKKMRDFTLAELLVKYETESAVLSEEDKRELWAAFHNRIAFAFGSFIFVFIGIPIAILVRRGEIALSFAISMAMACLYYILFVGAKTLSIRGFMPPFFAFWLPNIMLIAVGVYLMRRSILS
ncbi:MAG: LptF/LptG family permease, partial [Candidatus Omnitrophica bacterium]|nr:LptF/LptG family permease [Candidatus Omnitrophota bacterium]